MKASEYINKEFLDLHISRLKNRFWLFHEMNLNESPFDDETHRKHFLDGMKFATEFFKELERYGLSKGKNESE